MDKPNVAFVDADFLVYRIGFSCAEDEPLQIAKNRLTEYLNNIVFIRLKCEDYEAFITGRTNFRHAIATTVPYKGNRKNVAKPKYYDELRSHLVALGATVSENQEADDDVAIRSTQYQGYIVHVDKDLDQLPGWHYNPVQDKEYFLEPLEGTRNFYSQLLQGDRTDNIQGIKGIGPKKAEKLLKECQSEEDMYEAVKEAYTKAGESHDRLVENGQLLWLSRYQGQIWQPPS